jgi:hypothetical protein
MLQCVRSRSPFRQYVGQNAFFGRASPDLGCFMETISMMFLTTPFIFPIVVKLGRDDPIWWGSF